MGEGTMPVLITAIVEGQTREGYDQAMLALRPLLERAKGFVAHGAGMSLEGWRVFEIWESQQEATDFFAKYIRPMLPPGMKPKRMYLDLHNLMFRPQEKSAAA